jgi:hypothetical protein
MIVYLKWQNQKKTVRIMAGAKPRNPCRSLFMRLLQVTRSICTQIYTVLMQGVGTICTDQVPPSHVLKGVHTILASRYSSLRSLMTKKAQF